MLQPWKIHKFGGTSVLNAERYKNVYEILNKQADRGKISNRQAIVVSAMKGTTDDLIKAVELARSNDDAYKGLLQKIQDRHVLEISNLLHGEKKTELLQILNADFNKLTEILRGVWLVKNSSDRIIEMVSGMGEVWSAQILNSYFQQQGQSSQWLDARDVLVVEHINQRVVIDWEKSQINFDKWKKQNTQDRIIITGYVAALDDGTVTTLGRNGSDYSASIFGILFNSDEIFIWTDVDGVLSADPRLEPEAIVLDEMSYNEVMELAYFGAKVIHPATILPAIKSNIPIWIKNTFNPDFNGTKIHKNAKSDRVVKGFSTIDKMALFNIEGTGMVGIPGVAERLFGALRAQAINVVLISQASSEQSICFIIAAEKSLIAKRVIEEAFYGELKKGLIQSIQIQNDVSILAAVGDSMAYSPGVAGQFFTALGLARINVRAIAQGSSERNISAVIDTRDAIKALRIVHSSFILPRQRISVGLIGVGLIGGTFLKQLHEHLEELRTQKHIEVQVRAIADSKKMLLSENAINLENWIENFATHSDVLDLNKFSKHVQTTHIPHAVIIECTASSALSPFYIDWLKQGVHIISPNKKANTNSMKEYNEIRLAAKKSNRHYLYSTNVGAGLPIIQTLRDLYSTGDKILTIQGILSGTLSFIFNEYDGSQPFSEVVRLAKDKGYTEPDPREDLSGQDVMRKIVILAREAGLNIEPNEVHVESLVPSPLLSVSADEFMQRLPELDSHMAQLVLKAQQKEKVLRFVGTIDQSGKARVGIEELSKTHPFANVSGTDNIVLFQTKRYTQQPLVVKGPGAGPEVTAAGVFADLLRLSKYLGAV